MWPFKAPKRVTIDEYAATQPLAPCGQQGKHYSLTLQGLPCPACSAIATRKRRESEQDALAKKIAAELLRLMNEKGQP